MVGYEQKIRIKHWAEEDRPREKLLQHGHRHLTDAELIAILIGSGNKHETAVDVSKRILSHYQHNLVALGKASVQELSKFKGIGEAKAIAIIAGLELGLRRGEASDAAPEIMQVTSSNDVGRYLHPTFAHLNHEEFWMLLVNRSNRVLGKKLISKGGQAGTIADPKIVFKIALENNAAKIVLAHNHPSGNLNPSSNDLKLTKNMIKAGELLDIMVIDHLIFSDIGYFSFKDGGLL